MITYWEGCTWGSLAWFTNGKNRKSRQEPITHFVSPSHENEQDFWTRNCLKKAQMLQITYLSYSIDDWTFARIAVFKLYSGKITKIGYKLRFFTKNNFWIIYIHAFTPRPQGVFQWNMWQTTKNSTKLIHVSE